MSPTTPNLFQSFADLATTSPHKKAVTAKCDNVYRPLTYDEIYKKSIQLGELLIGLGINPDDKVTIILENHPEYAVAFFAVMYSQATAVLLDVQYSPQQVRNLAMHSDSKVLIVSGKNYAAIKNCVSDEFEVLDIGSEDFQNRMRSYSTDSRFKTREGPESPLAVLFYTSGTTDSAKAVMLTHGNLLANVNSLKQLNLVTPEDVVISILPLHHTYSFTVTLLTPLLLGATIVYPPSLNSLDLLNCMKETQTTIFVGVPQVFSLLYRSIITKMKFLPVAKRTLLGWLSGISRNVRKTTGINWGKGIFADMHKVFGKDLRFMVSGGARLDPEIAFAFYGWGFTILEGYGLTETSPVATFNLPQSFKIGSVGKPIPQVEIKIVNPDDSGVGEVAIRGPNVMLGYYHMKRQTEAVIKEGWFMTGDLGYLDKEGFLSLVGRKKEIIVLSNGKNIYPDEVEKHYGQNPFIKEIAVLATEDTSDLAGGEKLVAIIVLDEEYFKSQNEMNLREKIRWELENLSVKLPSYQRITGFAISQESLPRTRLGKIMRYKLEDLYLKLKKTLEDEAGVDDEPVFQEYSETTRKALHALEEILKKPVKLKDHLELDLGLDSLNRIELLLNLESRLNLKMSETEAMEFFLSSTVEQLLQKLEKVLPKIAQEDKPQDIFHWEKVLQEPSQTETLKSIQICFGIGSIIFNVLVISVFKLFFKVFYLLRTEGIKNLSQKGPYLICPNHTSYLDGLFILSALPYRIALQTYFLGYRPFFDNVFVKRFVKVARLIPLELTFNLIEALKACAFVLKSNKILCYFPEGQRSIDGKVKDFKKGVGILIKELDIPVIPVYIEGAYRTWSRTMRFPKLAPVKVVFGENLFLKDLTVDAPGQDVYKGIAKNLQEYVQKLGGTSSN